MPDPMPDPMPDVARRLFAPDRLRLAQQYAALLAGDGVVRGLIGPREAPRLWERHLLNCAVLSEQVPAEADVCDVGSGAGLPGVVLAIARPDLVVTLVEPLLRRTAFLVEVVELLELDNVEVVRARAEALHGHRRFTVVTSRAVAPLERLLTWSMPLVAAEGVLLAMKGASVTEEIAVAGPTLARLGCGPVERLELGADVLSSPTHAVRVTWADPSAVSWPRAVSPGVDRPQPRPTRTGKRRRQRDR